MNIIRASVYMAIALHFLRLTRRKLLRPSPKLAMPPAAPGDTPERVTLAALVETTDEWAAFMVSGAATATISSSQASWLHHEMYRASDVFLQELPGKGCGLRLCPWPPDRKKPPITAHEAARMFGLSGTREARFISRFDSLVRQFNEAVYR